MSNKNLNKKALIINMFAGPGCGKSTLAAYVFSKLKMARVNAELVTEYAKDKVWEDTHAPFENQLYMLAKQYFRLTRCEDKVDIIITDSPILLSLIYNNDKERLGYEFDSLVKHLFNYYDTYNVLLTRVKPYNPVGRFQTEDESKQLDKQIKNMLIETGVEFKEYVGNQTGGDLIVEDVLKILKVN